MKESSKDYVTLAAVYSAGLVPVLDFIYGGSLTLAEENLKDIIAVASYLQIHCVLDCCCDFVRHILSPDNCLEYLTLASTYALDTVTSKDIHQDSVMQCIELFIMQSMSDLCQLNEHVKIPFETMRKIAASNEVKTTELTLYNIIVDWLLAEPGRQEYSDELLKHIRFVSVPVGDLGKLQTPPDCGAATVLCGIQEALNYVTLPITKKIQSESPVRGKPCIATVYRKWDVSNTACMHVLLNNDGESLSSKAREWIQMERWPTECAERAAASIKNFLFICGGHSANTRFSTTSSRECHVFDTVTWQWGKIAPMNIARGMFTLIVHDEELYAIGWTSQGDYVDSIEKYSLRENCWEVVAHYPVPAAYVAAVSAAGLIYMYGGENPPNQAQCFQSFDPCSGEQKPLPLYDTYDAFYMDCALLSLKDYLCVVSPRKNKIKDLMCFNINTEQWVRFSCNNFFEFALQTGYLVDKDDHSIYCIGGYQNLQFVPNFDKHVFRLQYIPQPSGLTLFDPMCCWLAMPYGRLAEARMRTRAHPNV